MQEMKMQELAQISGGGFSLTGGGGGNPGQYIAGNIGITHKPETSGFGFSYSHNIAHVNGLGTFSSPASAMITFTKRW